MKTYINRKKSSILALTLVMILSLFALAGCADDTSDIYTSNDFAVAVSEITEEGDVIFKTTLLELNERGVNIGDAVTIKIGEFSGDVTVASAVVEEPGTLQFWCNNESSYMVLTTYGESFADTIDVTPGTMVKITKTK